MQNKEDLTRWLKTQPREVCVVFAARAALRVLPLHERTTETEKTLKHGTLELETILSSFWACAITLAAGVWPDKNLTSMKDGVAFAATLADTKVSSNSAYSALAAYSTNYSTAAAARAVNTATEAIRIYDEIRVPDQTSPLYSEYTTDINFIKSGGLASSLAVNPLWATPLGPDPAIKKWLYLKDMLLKIDADWNVWTSWYDDRLLGKPLIESIELGNPQNEHNGRVTFFFDDYKSPKIVNPKIRKIIEDYWADHNLAQDIAVETFKVERGRLETQTQEVGVTLTKSEIQYDWYEALRDSVEDALEVGVNALGVAYKPLLRLYEALPENFNDARVAKLWPRANKLRRMMERHERVSSLEEFDINRLGADAADLVRAIVDNYNNLRIGDPALSASDDNAISPQEAEIILSEILEVRPLLENIIEEGLANEEASEVLEEALAITIKDDIAIQNKIMGRLEIIQYRGVIRNAVKSLLLWARENRVQVVTGSAGSIVLAEKIVEYSARILLYAETALPGMGRLVASIIRALN